MQDVFVAYDFPQVFEFPCIVAVVDPEFQIAAVAVFFAEVAAEAWAVAVAEAVAVLVADAGDLRFEI